MGGAAHLADLLGEEQKLGQPDAVPGQVVSEAAQRHVLHDELHGFLAWRGTGATRADDRGRGGL